MTRLVVIALALAATSSPTLAQSTLVLPPQGVDVVRPFELAFKAIRAYYLVMEPQKSGHPAIGPFRDWLRARLDETAAAVRPA
jgi:hypothetical protein